MQGLTRGGYNIVLGGNRSRRERVARAAGVWGRQPPTNGIRSRSDRLPLVGYNSSNRNENVWMVVLGVVHSAHRGRAGRDPRGDRRPPQPRRTPLGEGEPAPPMGV